MVRERVPAMPTVLAQAITLLLVIVGWVFFRATDMHMAGELLAKMFWPRDGLLPEGALLFGVIIVIAAVLARSAPNAFEYHSKFKPTWPRMAAAAAVFGVAVAFIAGSRDSPFLYFQF